MSTRLEWAAASLEQADRTVGSRARDDGGRRRPPARLIDGELGWRSHTFADGVRSLTLTGPLDVAMAGRLWTRISELVARGCRRLIVDASAIDPAGEEPALLAGAFLGRPVSYDAVVVVPSGSALVDLLPAWVGTSLSLGEARRQLGTGLVRRETRRRSGPGAAMPLAERHALAVRQALRWAGRSAREGDYERALGWLAMVERIEGVLGEPWAQHRRAWQAAWQAQTASGPTRAATPVHRGRSTARW